jgi:GNAT superfamily N-acetyltransferase
MPEPALEHWTIRVCEPEEFPALTPGLARILVDCVEGGASVSFMSPFTQSEAEAFFTKCAASAARGERVILAAFDPQGVAAGTVQLILEMPPNQPHRADLTKLLVHRAARNRGIAARLMLAAEAEALARGRNLLVLDTITGSSAERLYLNLGWNISGVIPQYALMPDGSGPFSTTVLWKKIP